MDGMAVGGTAVAVGGMGVAGTGVAVGGMGVAVGGRGVAVGIGVAVGAAGGVATPQPLSSTRSTSPRHAREVLSRVTHHRRIPRMSRELLLSCDRTLEPVEP